MTAAYRIFTRHVGSVETLTGAAEGDFGLTGDPVADVLAATAVHPMSEDELHAFLRKAQRPWAAVQQLVSDGRVRLVEHAGTRYYVRRFASGR